MVFLLVCILCFCCANGSRSLACCCLVAAVTERYLEILQTQRLEFQDLMATRLREQKNELTSQMLQALQDKEATIQNVLSTALEVQMKEHEEDKKVFEEIITSEIQSSLDEKYSKTLEEYKNQFGLIR